MILLIEKGDPIELSKDGKKRVAQRFDELEKLGYSLKFVARTKKRNELVAVSYSARTSYPERRELPSVQELFQVSQGERYQLSIEMQLFLLTEVLRINQYEFKPLHEVVRLGPTVPVSGHSRKPAI